MSRSPGIIASKKKQTAGPTPSVASVGAPTLSQTDVNGLIEVAAPAGLADGTPFVCIVTFPANRAVTTITNKSGESGRTLPSLVKIFDSQMGASSFNKIIIYEGTISGTAPTGWIWDLDGVTQSFGGVALRIADAGAGIIETFPAADSVTQNNATLAIAQLAGLAARKLVIGAVSVQHETDLVKTCSVAETGWTEHVDSNLNATKDLMLAIYSKQFPSGGDTGVLTATITQSSIQRLHGVLFSVTA